MRWHVSNLVKIPHVEIVGLVDPDPGQVNQTLTQFPQLRGIPTFNDFEDLLDQVDLDAVEISTPHTQHRHQVESCFEKGLHVLIEKPLATTIEDSEAMIQARDRSGKVGYLSYQRHTSAEFMWVKKHFESGRFGSVQMVSALLCQDWKAFTVGSWRQDPALSGGGMFLDSGSHMLDALLWMTGLEPETVNAHTHNRGTPVEINAAVSFTCKNGALGSIAICGDAPTWHEELVIWCDKAAIFLRNGKLSIRESDGRADMDDLRGGSNPDESFIRTIRGHEPNPTAFEDGLKVMKLSQAAYDSATSGGKSVQL